MYLKVEHLAQAWHEHAEILAHEHAEILAEILALSKLSAFNNALHDACRMALHV